MSDKLQVVIVTGMSGSGKTVALQSLEDIGFYTIDNLPPQLLPDLIQVMVEEDASQPLALGMDLRSGALFDSYLEEVKAIRQDSQIDLCILYMEAEAPALVSRYKETRRGHPLAPQGRITEGIEKEREALQRVKETADEIIDTTHLRPRDLRKEIQDKFHTSKHSGFRVEVLSFGFKKGLPIDADIVMDVRFLPNPYYIENLRPLNGKDEPVYDYVMDQPQAEVFFTKFADLIDFLLPGYEEEGKNHVTIAIGCTGGQHRSVAMVERLGHHIKDQGYATRITHRDL